MKKFDIRILRTLALAPAVLLFTSCRSSDTDQTLSTGPAAVSFNLAGTDYAQDNSNGPNPTASTEKTSVNTNNSDDSRTALITPSYVVVTEYVPASKNQKSYAQASAGISPVAAVSGNTLNSGNKFRVIAYRSGDGSYHTYQDYTIGQPGQPMMLDAGVPYNIIVYSYGTTTLPNISSGEQSNINSAVVNYDNTNRDFMYQNISVTPAYTENGQTNTLSITLRHKTTQVTPIITTSPTGISTISNAVFTPHFSDGTIPLATGSVTGRITSTNQPLTFPGPFPATTQTGNTVLVNADTGGNATGSFTADITIGGITKTVAFNNAFKVTPESTGNLNINLIKCGAYTAPGVFTEFMCFNLGTNTNINPFTPSAAIHGAKYQWGAQTGETGRYVSQEEDQSNSGAIAGWNNTNTAQNTWLDAIKTSKDPCPSGYRVPTSVQWQGVINNNPITRIGTPWSDSPTNYNSLIKIGNNLALPIAGVRDISVGGLQVRGRIGYYWSSTNANVSQSKILFITGTNYTISNAASASGYSVRCIADPTQTTWNSTDSTSIDVQFNK
ncbi:fibrobacter succinogenes major paralogous domain-containing protein [Elizabethkingia anophelis]|uniref:hypothetical protein n=1 Tax=Elizabethkingia anophelis TaxID=1117645 RepID=UPI0038913309